MSKTSSLSGEEVAALMDELSEAAEIQSASPQPFSFGSDPLRPLAAIPALDRMSERAARKLRERIEPISRVKPRVSAEPVSVIRFEDWKVAQPEFTSISLYRFRPLKGACWSRSLPISSDAWSMHFMAASEFIVNGLLRNSPPQRSGC